MVAPCAPYRTISTVRYRGGVDLRRQIRDIINRQLALGGFYILASLSQWKRVRFASKCVLVYYTFINLYNKALTLILSN